MFIRDYYVALEKLPAEEGGGWLGTVPDLPGCMSDSDDFASLEANVADAIDTWIAAAHRMGREVPSPADATARRARSIAETAAAALKVRVAPHNAQVSDEEIGLYLWHERGFRDHDTLVALINHTREMLDRREVAAARVSCQPETKSTKARPSARRPRPVQLALDLVTA
jgi:predicted RNase H-like HicB family nuclease